MSVHTMQSGWLTALRWPFLIAMLVPIVVGTGWIAAAALPINGLILLQTVLAALSLHAAANVLNDVQDAKSGTDELNHSPLTPFAGGSRVIQQGRLTLDQMRLLGWGLTLAGVALGLTLVWQSGLGLLWLGLAGVLIGLGYSVGPYPLNYHGWGEVAIFLCFGPLAVAGTIYTQLGYFPSEAWLLGLVPGLFVLAIMLVNELPDAPSDQASGKKTWAVLAGVKAARSLLLAAIITGFAILIAGAAWGLWPSGALLALLAMPIGVLGWWKTPVQCRHPEQRIAGIKLIVLTPMLFAVLFIAGLYLLV